MPPYFSEGPDPTAVIKEIMIGNLSEVGCALRLDRCRDKADVPVAVQVLVETGLERFQSHAASRHDADSI